MNRCVRSAEDAFGPPPSRPPTQAAEGLPRWRWTLQEFERFIDLGIFAEGDRVELIGEELVPMSPEGNAHETLKFELTEWMRDHLPREVRYLVEPGWRPGGDSYLEPDILVVPAGAPLHQTPATDALLVIEVAVSSADFDLTTKARTYAALGVRDYWVMLARSGETHVHRQPTPEGYTSVTVVPGDQPVAALLVDQLKLTVGDLPAG